MDDETEVIKQQMAQTRESLAEKVEALEQKVVGTVQEATETVASTVESVSDTMASVKDTVNETVDTVKDSLSGAIETARDALDVTGHMERHPWPMFVGSIAVGFLGGWLLGPSGSRRDERDERWPDMSGSHHHGMIPEWFHRSSGQALPPPQYGTEPKPQAAQAHEPARPSWTDQLMGRFQPALDQLQEVAVTAGTGLLADMILKHVPQHLRGDVSGVIDQFSTAIGGKPTGRATSESRQPATAGNGRTA